LTEETNQGEEGHGQDARRTTSDPTLGQSRLSSESDFHTDYLVVRPQVLGGEGSRKLIPIPENRATEAADRFCLPKDSESACVAKESRIGITLFSQSIAVSLVSALTEGVLLWQVACEYLAASRKLESLGYNRAQAYQYIRDLQQVWYTAIPTWGVLDRAEDLMSRFSLSHWDSMIIASCLEVNVQTFYTEDLGYSSIDGLGIVNPFKVP
jgi:predicted nucleic acid-binding protein